MIPAGPGYAKIASVPFSSMSRTPQEEQALRGMRSVLVMVIFTFGSVYSVRGGAFPPTGNPLAYSLGLSWLIAMTFAVMTSAIFSKANPTRFSPAYWEKHGEIYERAGIRAFRWMLLHSPLGWINPNFPSRARRADCDRLLREMNTAEAVHWLTFVVTVTLAIRYLRHDHAVYGYAMLLVRIPFDLYPIMLQRWNRERVWRLLKRAARAEVAR